jgi:hypothetical protein
MDLLRSTSVVIPLCPLKPGTENGQATTTQPSPPGSIAFSWMPSKAHPGTILKRRQTWPVAPVALVCGSHNMASVSSTAWMSRMKCCRLPNQKRVYRHLRCADVVATDLPSSSYVLCTLILADEHLADLKPVYLEAERLLDSGGSFVLIGYHLFFLMNGTPTHYHRADGVAVTIQSHVRLFSEHYQAGNNADLTLLEFQERVIDEDWLLTKPSGDNTALARQFCVGLAHAQIRHANSPGSRHRSRHRQPRSQRPALLVISQHRKFLVRAIQNRARLRPPQLFTREHPLGHPVQIKLLEFQKLLSPLSRPGVHAAHRSTSYMRRSAT